MPRTILPMLAISESGRGDESAFEAAYASFLAALWDDLDELLESHYGARVRLDEERLRMRLVELRLRLLVLMKQTRPFVNDGHGAVTAHATRLRSFGEELLRLLDIDMRDDKLDLACGATMVLAQNRILDEVRRVSSAH